MTPLPPRRFFPGSTPTPNPQVWQSGVRAAYKSPNPGTGVVVELDNGEIGTYDGTKQLQVGDRVMVRQNTAGGSVWDVQPLPGEAPVRIAFRKAWEFDNSSSGHSNVEPHPTNRDLLIVGTDSTLKVINWRTETVVDSEAFGSVIKWVAPVFDIAGGQRLIGVALTSSPYIAIIPVDQDGVLGTAYSDPGTLPPTAGSQIGWAQFPTDPFADDVLYIVMDSTDVTDPVTCYPVTGGAFGTKLSAATSLTDGWGFGVAPGDVQTLVTAGLVTPAASLSSVGTLGIGVSPEGQILFGATDTNSFNFIRNLQLLPDSPGYFGQSTDIEQIAGNLATLGGAFFRFHPRGHLVASAAINDGNVGSGDWATSAYIQQFNGPNSIGPLLPMPLWDRLGDGFANIAAPWRGISWRPHPTKDQLLVPVYPQLNDGTDREVRLVLATIENGRWAAHYNYEPGPDQTDGWSNDEDTATCWVDAGTLMVIPSVYGATAHSLLVFDVRGD